MLNETLESDREYRKSIKDEYTKGYEKGRNEAYTVDLDGTLRVSADNISTICK